MTGISQPTYFNWKKKYDGLLQTEMRRLKQLEDENGKLRQPLWPMRSLRASYESGRHFVLKSRFMAVAKGRWELQ
jgi:hypothetical protein